MKTLEATRDEDSDERCAESEGNERMTQITADNAKLAKEVMTSSRGVWGEERVRITSSGERSDRQGRGGAKGRWRSVGIRAQRAHIAIVMRSGARRAGGVASGG